MKVTNEALILVLLLRRLGVRVVEMIAVDYVPPAMSFSFMG